MSNSTSSNAFIDSHAKPFFGTANKEPTADLLAEKGFAKFVYRIGSRCFATYDARNGGFRLSSARSSAPSNLAIKLADFLNGR